MSTERRCGSPRTSNEEFSPEFTPWGGEGVDTRRYLPRLLSDKRHDGPTLKLQILEHALNSVEFRKVDESEQRGFLLPSKWTKVETL